MWVRRRWFRDARRARSSTTGAAFLDHRRLVLRAGGRFERVMSMVGRIPVMDVMPLVDLGRLPAKATVHEPLPVSATVFREGHDKLGAEVVLVAPDGMKHTPARMTATG